MPVVYQKSLGVTRRSSAEISHETRIIRTRWSACCRGWYNEERGTQSGRSIASQIVTDRNNRIGHGVLDEITLNHNLSALPANVLRLLDVLADLLPTRADGDSDFLCVSPEGNVPVEIAKVSDGFLVLVRKIERRGSVWRLKGQTLDPRRSQEVLFELGDSSSLVEAIGQQRSGLISRNVLAGENVWHASISLPSRQTDVFVGRRNETDELADWWEDTDSRACLIYGEGGIGKTTLVLEFLNNMIEDPPVGLIWKPHIIFFYSAKTTRWGVDGLEFIRGGLVPHVNESIRSFVRIFEPILGREWQSENTRSLVDKAAIVCENWGVNRNSILIVLDNTETLARSQSDELELGKALRVISSRLARVIITSRRRESVEARQVPIEKMSDEIGAQLLRHLGSAYGALALNQAGEAGLKKAARKLSGKPILLDVLARHISVRGCGIEAGVNSILRHERGDLGRFLFDDAWNRIAKEHQNVFLVVAQLGGVASDQVLGWACMECGVGATEWLDAFAETKFGSLMDYGTHYDVLLESGTREFLAIMFNELTSPEKQNCLNRVSRIRKLYEKLLVAESQPINDRVLQAFRTTPAKAAKLAAERRDFEEAVMFYEEAMLVDSQNAALFDRFAWYLMVNGQLERAVLIARKATELDKESADALFTLGMVYARRGDIDWADEWLGKAQEKGKSRRLVAMQKARARIERAANCKIGSGERLEFLNIAADMLAAIRAMYGEFTHWKDRDEFCRLDRRIAGLRGVTAE